MTTITCQVPMCKHNVHVIKNHLKECHQSQPEGSEDYWDIEKYRAEFPDAPELSKQAAAMLKSKVDALKKANGEDGEPEDQQASDGRVSARSIFGKSFENKSDIGITVLNRDDIDSDHHDAIPVQNDTYVYESKTLFNLLLGVELNKPVLLWGHLGTGKSELIEQVCARTNRPFVRIQHTGNTEESHIVGEKVVKTKTVGKQITNYTEFEYGALPLAMINGYTYCADEYDLAPAEILVAYQAVLEGKPLYIKEAEIGRRLIKPHKNFRFVATANTNGSGDKTGLYQGAMIGNAANYSRFGFTIRVKYMKPEHEIDLLVRRLELPKEEAKLGVEFATLIREAFENKNISLPISPRELINAMETGFHLSDYPEGFRLAFVNRLPDNDEPATAEQILQRVFA